MDSAKKRRLVLGFVFTAAGGTIIALSLLCSRCWRENQPQGKQFSGDTDRAARTKVRELQRTLGLHRSADGKMILTKEYDADSLKSVLEALDSRYPTVRQRAADLTRLAVEQLDLPARALDNIVRKVRPIAEQDITDSMDIHQRGRHWKQGAAIRSARSVLWQVGLKRLDSKQLKLAFFRDQLLGKDADSIDPSLQVKIVEYLSAMHVKEAKAILEEYLEASSRMHPVGRDRIKQAIEKIDVSRRLSKLEAPAKIEKLVTILEESPDLNMRIWAVRQIAKMGSDKAISELENIMNNKQRKVQVRYEAQEMLKVLGVLPKDVYRIARPD